MVQELNGQYNLIRAKFVRRCNFNDSYELKFLNMLTTSHSFSRSLAQLPAEINISKDLQNGTFSICRLNFHQHCRYSGCYIYFAGRFLCLSGSHHVLFFCSSLSSVRHPISLQLEYSTYRYHFFLSKYDEGIHNSIQSRLPVPAAHIQLYVSDISSGNITRQMHNYFSPRTISQTVFLFFLFHFQKGYNITESEEFKCCMYSRPHAKPTASNNLPVITTYILV